MGREEWLKSAGKYRKEEERKQLEEEKKEKEKAAEERRKWLKSPEGKTAQKAAKELGIFMGSEDGKAADELLESSGHYIPIWENTDDGGDSVWTVNFYGTYAEYEHYTINGQGDENSLHKEKLNPLEIIEYGIESGIEPQNFIQFIVQRLDKIAKKIK